MEDSSIVPIAGIVMIICVVVFPVWIRFHYASRDRARLHETVRIMVEKGQPVSSELLESLNVAPNSASVGRVDGGAKSDMRRGVSLLMVAFALVVLGFGFYYITGGVVTNILIGVAAFPGFIGLGSIIMALINRPKTGV
jgi:hypothetical protein